MNTLHAFLNIVFENRWNLLWSFIAISLGYVSGCYYIDYIGQQNDRKSAGTDLMMTETVQPSSDFWRKIQLKIDQIAGNVIGELAYTSQRVNNLTGDIITDNSV